MLESSPELGRISKIKILSRAGENFKNQNPLQSWGEFQNSKSSPELELELEFQNSKFSPELELDFTSRAGENFKIQNLSSGENFTSRAGAGFLSGVGAGILSKAGIQNSLQSWSWGEFQNLSSGENFTSRAGILSRAGAGIQNSKSHSPERILKSSQLRREFQNSKSCERILQRISTPDSTFKKTRFNFQKLRKERKILKS